MPHVLRLLHFRANLLRANRLHLHARIRILYHCLPVASRSFHRNPIALSLRGMKRKATAPSGQKPKRLKEAEADYCDVNPRTDGEGNVLWPASPEAMQNAREFIKDW